MTATRDEVNRLKRELADATSDNVALRTDSALSVADVTRLTAELAAANRHLDLLRDQLASLSSQFDHVSYIIKHIFLFF